VQKIARNIFGGMLGVILAFPMPKEGMFVIGNAQ
jgi:hypothetical protein